MDTIRELVSNDRKRYKSRNSNLDLSYITDKILAMSFPATGVEALWRNSLHDVHNLLQRKHGQCFMVWNLSEKSYSTDKLDTQSRHIPFLDHHPPPLELHFEIVNTIDSWLMQNMKNVAVVHCVGGKGRTGTIVVCLLFYSGCFTTLEECDKHFANKRSMSGRGVTQPGQRKYCEYFQKILADEPRNMRPLVLKSIEFTALPSSVASKYFIEVYDSPLMTNLVYRSDEDPANNMITTFNVGAKMKLDIYVIVKKKSISGNVKLFHLCFHTFFVNTKTYIEELGINDLDHPDTGFLKSLPKEFGIKVFFDPPDLNDKEMGLSAAMIVVKAKYLKRRQKQLNHMDNNDFRGSKHLGIRASRQLSLEDLKSVHKAAQTNKVRPKLNWERTTTERNDKPRSVSEAPLLGSSRTSSRKKMGLASVPDEGDDVSKLQAEYEMLLQRASTLGLSEDVLRKKVNYSRTKITSSHESMYEDEEEPPNTDYNVELAMMQAEYDRLMDLREFGETLAYLSDSDSDDEPPRSLTPSKGSIPKIQIPQKPQGNTKVLNKSMTQRGPDKSQNSQPRMRLQSQNQVSAETHRPMIELREHSSSDPKINDRNFLNRSYSEKITKEPETQGSPLRKSTVATFSQPNSNLCARCKLPITSGKMYKALNQKWHSNCFTCSNCNTLIVLPTTYGNKGGQPFCHKCSTEMRQCVYCKKQVEGSGLQLAKVGVFHPNCYSIYKTNVQ